MQKSDNLEGGYTARTRRNTKTLMIWTLAWVLTVALSTFGPKFLWNYDTTLTTLALILNVGMGVAMILANKVFLADSDEMQRKIQLDAMALTLGAVLVGGIAYSTMDQTNLIAGDAEIGFLIMFMGITYMISIFVGRLRYQ